MMPQTHKNTHSLFVQKEAEFKQRKGVIRLVPMLVTGCKNQRSKQGKKEQRTPAAQGQTGSAQPQHRGFDIQRRYPSRELC